MYLDFAVTHDLDLCRRVICPGTWLCIQRFAEEDSCFNFLDTLSFRLGYQQRESGTKCHDAREKAKHTTESDLLGDGTKGKSCQDSTCLSGSSGNAMSRSSYSSRKDLYR